MGVKHRSCSGASFVELDDSLGLSHLYSTVTVHGTVVLIALPDTVLGTVLWCRLVKANDSNTGQGTPLQVVPLNKYSSFGPLCRHIFLFKAMRPDGLSPRDGVRHEVADSVAVVLQRPIRRFQKSDAQHQVHTACHVGVQHPRDGIVACGSTADTVGVVWYGLIWSD